MCSRSFNASCRYHFHSLPVDIIIYLSVSFPLGIVKNNKFAIAFCFPWIWLVVYAIIIITNSSSATPYYMHKPRTNRNRYKIIPHIILFILPRSLCLCQFPFLTPLHRRWWSLWYTQQSAWVVGWTEIKRRRLYTPINYKTHLLARSIGKWQGIKLIGG